MPKTESEILPLVVDLDGTLIHSDVLIEGILALIHRAPLKAASLLVRHFGSPQMLKVRIAEETTLDPGYLPWNEAVLARIQAHRQAGGRVYLATAAAESAANAVAGYLGVFDGVFASTPTRNLKGTAKAALLESEFGKFDYIGDSAADLPVWAAAREAFCVAPSRRILRRCHRAGIALRSVGPEQKPFSLLAAMRPLQWLKNLLIFVPVVAHHAVPEPDTLAGLALLFAAFCLVCSANYLLNDLFDLDDDRRHPGKRLRPLAEGSLHPLRAVQGIGGLIVLTIPILFFLPVQALAWLIAYAGLAALYSHGLKRIPGVDLICLTLFYGIRIQAGASVAQIPLSGWLMALALTGFLTLGLFKRSTELQVRKISGHTESSKRSYRSAHYKPLRLAGFLTGCVSALTLGAYAFSTNATHLYHRPWLFIPIAMLGFVANIHFWKKARPGPHGDDPIRAVFFDPALLLAGAAIFALLCFAV